MQTAARVHSVSCGTGLSPLSKGTNVSSKHLVPEQVYWPMSAISLAQVSVTQEIDLDRSNTCSAPFCLVFSLSLSPNTPFFPLPAFLPLPALFRLQSCPQFPWSKPYWRKWELLLNRHVEDHSEALLVVVAWMTQMACWICIKDPNFA